MKTIGKEEIKMIGMIMLGEADEKTQMVHIAVDPASKKVSFFLIKDKAEDIEFQVVDLGV